MKQPAPFAYQVGEVTDGNNRPIIDRAFIEIVEAHDPQVLLGEIDIDAADAPKARRADRRGTSLA